MTSVARPLFFSGIVLVACSSAHAGGLCGDGGLIGGDLGKWCNDAIEEPITTPIAKGATVAVTTAVGTVVGGALGAPVTGATVGEYTGNTINERAAGKSPPIGRPAVHGAKGKRKGEATFRITSEYKYIVYVRFFSQDRSVVWPGAHGAYALKNSAPHDLTVQCNVGEKICYGAYDTARSYWGAGPKGDKACKSCCQTCDPKGAKLYFAKRLTD